MVAAIGMIVQTAAFGEGPISQLKVCAPLIIYCVAVMVR